MDELSAIRDAEWKAGERLRFRGTLVVRPMGEGPRSHPIWPGYRPQGLFSTTVDEFPRGEGSSVEFHDCQVDFEGSPIEPGASGAVTLRPIAPEFWRGLREGDSVGLYEGLRRTATVTISAVPSAEAFIEWERLREALTGPEARAEIQRRANHIATAAREYSTRRPDDIRER